MESVSPMPSPFGDVESLLERSRPRPRVAWLWYGAGLVLLMFLGGVTSGQSDGARAMLQGLTSLVVVGLFCAMVISGGVTLKRVRTEQHRVVAIDELIQLRRWPEAAALVMAMLSRPMLTPQARAAGLIYLARLLSRYDRFGDAATMIERVLGEQMVDAETAWGLRVDRAFAVLHDDRLWDADRAINELRRQPWARESGAMALVELYRDVKTGHPQDAIERFNEKLPAMRAQLGIRLADAYALVARAYDLLENTGAAAIAYRQATLLVGESELQRRYGEFKALAGRYAAADRPDRTALTAPRGTEGSGSPS